MTEPTRILHVLGGLDRGGAESIIMNLYRNIDRNLIQFDFIKHHDEMDSFEEEIKSLGGLIYSIPEYTGINHFEYKKSWDDFFVLHPEYQIIHGHVRSTASIYLKIAKKHGRKTISHSHNTSSGKGISAVVKNILQYPIRNTADYLFACSKEAGEWLFGEDVMDRDNFHIFNNAIDVKKFLYNKSTRIKVRKEFNLTDELVIGHVGRFSAQKNHFFLIDIFKKLHNIQPNSKLILVGDGELKEKIIKKIKDLRLENSVILTGVRDDVNEIMQGFDVFLLPSIYEGLGIVAIEAQAAGLTTIVSDVIPSEAFITSNIKKKSLNESPTTWAEFIIENKDNNTKNTYSTITDADYDIHQAAKKLQEFYLKIN